MIPALRKEILFQTERLLIRKLTEKYFDTFHEMQSNIEVMKYATGKAQDFNENKVDLANVIKSYSTPNNTFWVWGITDLDDQLVGTIALIKDKEDNWEIGFRLLQSYWGKGYATEAVGGLINFATSIDAIQNLVAIADRRNIASQSVLNKSGFANLGISYNDIDKCEEYMYSINTNE